MAQSDQAAAGVDGEVAVPGDTPLFNCLPALARLGDAQSRRIRALATYEISQIDIAFATGTLLGQDRVIWEPVEID